MNREKTADSIELAFGMWTRWSPRNRLLDGGQDPPREFFGDDLASYRNSSISYVDLLLWKYCYIGTLVMFATSDF